MKYFKIFCLTFIFGDNFRFVKLHKNADFSRPVIVSNLTLQYSFGQGDQAAGFSAPSHQDFIYGLFLCF